LPGEMCERAKRVAEERGVKPCQALFASFLAALAEANMLNQATANFLARSAAPKLYAYLYAMGFVPERAGDPLEDTRRLVEAVNRALEIGDEVRVEPREGGLVLVGIGGSRCRYCPRGVGLAEIPWIACPFPKLLEGLLRLHGVDATVEPQEVEGQRRLIAKRRGLCWIKLRIRAGD